MQIQLLINKQNLYTLIMSVYSGFATRNQEMIYDSLIYNILSVFAIRILKFYKKEDIQQKKFKQVLQIQNKYLKKLEKRKYIEPKYSNILDELYDKIFHQQHNLTNNKEQHNEQNDQTFSQLTNQLYTLKEQQKKQLIQQKKNELQRIQQKNQSKKKHKKHKHKLIKNTTLHLNTQLQYIQNQKKQQTDRMPQLPNFRINQNQFSLKKKYWNDLKHYYFPEYKKGGDRVKIKEENLKRITYSPRHRNTFHVI